MLPEINMTFHVLHAFGGFWLCPLDRFENKGLRIRLGVAARQAKQKAGMVAFVQ